jgi:DNA repair protein RadB
MKISSGVDFVDALLDGGFENDVITTIYGPPGAGKTNLCLLAMSKIQHKKILYVDTEGSFSISRFMQVCGNYEEVMGRTIFLTPTTYIEQKEAFDILRKAANEDFGLIIIDSIASLYRLEIATSNDISNVNKELGIHMAMLTEIARKRKIPVIMTNQVYSDFDDREKIKTVGGDVIRYWSRALIELQKMKGDLRKVIIAKHRSIKEGNFAVFRIVQTGLEEVKG